MKKILLLAMLLCAPIYAFAAGTEIPVDPTASAYSYLYGATSQIANNLQSVAIKLFFALTLLQLVITGYGQVASGEIEASFGKYAKALVWISFVLYLMTNNHASAFIGNTLQYFLNHAIGWASGDATAKFNVGGILNTGMQAMGSTAAAIAKASVPTPSLEKVAMAVLAPGAAAAAALGTILYASLMTLLIYIIIIGVCGYIGLKVFMVKVEAALVLAIMPLSLAFLGLNAMRDQGFAPFKHMLALVYRIVILGAIVGGLAGVAGQMNSYANSAADPNVLEVSLLMVFGFAILAFLAHKSDSIASSLASGSASLGSGDIVGAAMSGAAAGGVAGAVTGAATGSVKSMADVMKGLTGGSNGSMSNASSRGTGNTPIEPAPSRPMASMSSGGGTSGGSGAPKRSAATGGNSSSSSPSASGGSSSAQSSSGGNSGSSSPSTSGGSSSAQSSAGGGSSAPSQDSAGSSSSSPTSSSSAGDTSSSSSAPSRSAAGNESGSGKSGSSSIPQQPMNSGASESAGIGGAPQRAGGQQPEPTTAPRKETNSEKLKRNANELGKRVEQENTTTSVSINTHHID
jgi:type IV secretion system protein TrbL